MPESSQLYPPGLDDPLKLFEVYVKDKLIPVAGIETDDEFVYLKLDKEELSGDVLFYEHFPPHNEDEQNENP